MLRRAIYLAKNWRMVLTELRLRTGPPYKSDQPISFPLDRAALEGAYIEWPATYAYSSAGRCVGYLKSGLAAHLPMRTVPVSVADSGNEAKPVTFRLIVRGQSYPVTIDYCDYMDQLYPEDLRDSLVYFKMQYRSRGYADVTSDSDRILPGGYINGPDHVYQYLGYLRAEAAKKEYTSDVFGRFGLMFAREIREKANQLLTEQKYFRYRGGLVMTRYLNFLRECAQARICLDLPSNSDFTFRLVDYLSVGCCVIGPKHRTRFHVDLEDRKNIVYVSRDLSDLVDTCRYYLEHDAEREAIRAQAGLYFDRYLHRDQLASYYLSESLSRIQNLRNEAGQRAAIGLDR
jgi:Glycosyl transferases group 1